MHPDFSQVPFQPLSLPAFIAAFIGAPCTDALSSGLTDPSAFILF